MGNYCSNDARRLMVAGNTLASDASSNFGASNNGVKSSLCFHGFLNPFSQIGFCMKPANPPKPSDPAPPRLKRLNGSTTSSVCFGQVFDPPTITYGLVKVSLFDLWVQTAHPPFV
ncbi:hypothetical protein TIFTF001_030815 [Ficus carica]|uniref:Uncharacterized protein n=1 Tax=Ficus carica TaxID=3494 RepID=A0AA88DV86_FICCA|nr:hypothetical protein TIFTF001_030815 [Ficus carica]